LVNCPRYVVFFEKLVDTRGEHRRQINPVFAGIVGEPGPVMDTSSAKLHEVFDVNVIGYFLCAREAVRSMQGRKGAIVNVSSRLSVLGGAGEQVHYAATKAAHEGFAVSLARELGPRGIRVNCVAPGFLETDLSASLSEDNRGRIARRSALGRLGNANDVASVIGFLGSGQAAFVSGQTLVVDGGG
jgi:NAD(P)-dependent dehydrogenase (short-subunit alcohol dehydrogenase family)